MSAEFRSVQTRMWREDDWFQNQPTDARLLFIYLFTNPSASVSGIYRLPLRTMAFESGLTVERVTALLAQFSQENKAHYEDGVIWVVKMRENQLPAKKTLSPQIATHLATEIEKIPSGRLKNMYLQAYGYPIDTLSIPYGCTVTVTDTDTGTVTDTATPNGVTPRAPKADVTQQQAMFGAIVDTCQLDANLQKSQIGKTASALVKAGYTPEQVRGFTDWWLSDSWRMEHTPVPTLQQLMTKIVQFKNGVTTVNGNGTNGHAPKSKVKHNLDAVDTYFAMKDAANHE